jgi:aminomethyltransferase
VSIATTSLHARHIALKAKMAPFAGFDMPLQYSSVKDEVLAVRQKVGVFDVSHMGEFFVTGPDAAAFVDYLTTNDFLNAPILKAVYSPLCKEDGTIIDDLISYKISQEEVLICVNASNIEKDWKWISSHTSGFDIKLENRSDDFSLLAVQGPLAEEVLKKAEVLTDADQMEYYSVLKKSLHSHPVILARTGYTGENGFEVFGPHEFIKNLWEKLISLEVTPCGLASRDVLRLEVCYPLYGHELSEEVNPLETGLKWTVKLAKPRFVGKEALESSKPRYQLIKLVLDKGIPREGYPVLNDNHEQIGTVTSGTMSVMLGKGIALALVDLEKSKQTKNYFIQVRQNQFPATKQTKAFYEGGAKA